MPSAIKWELKTFSELTSAELYQVMQLRNEVFVVEQNCVYQDADNKDQPSHQFMGWRENRLVAYTRIIPPQIAFSEPSIGRVVTSPSARGEGLGRDLMLRSIEVTRSLYPGQPIRIGAQLYLNNFYGSLGFQQTSGIYLEDNIEHIEMVLSPI
jgi:ElaA protein